MRNRASIVSFCNIVSQIHKYGQLKKHEKRLGEFFENFAKLLKTEIEKGQKATDQDLIKYQQAVSYGTADKESIETRKDILVKKLILFEPSLAPCFLKGGSIEKSVERKIHELATTCTELAYQINKAYRSKHGEDLFKATNETTKGWNLLGKPISNENSYGEFIDALYKIVWEGSGSGNRLGSTHSPLVKDIVILRTDLRHDIDHGKQSKIKAKEKQLEKTIQKYTGKSSVALLGKEDFLALQFGVLNGLEICLELMTP